MDVAYRPFCFRAPPLGTRCGGGIRYLLVLTAVFFQLGASYRTENFIVTAPTVELATEVARAAEQYRGDLARRWLGTELPAWQRPCVIEVREGPQVRLGGQTSFVFLHGCPTDWRMSIAGPARQILHAVLPHEILHTVLATHFRQPLPRIIEEGICVSAESEESRATLREHSRLESPDGTPMTLDQLLAARDYSANVDLFYSEGYSLTRYLLARGGRHTVIRFLADGLRGNNWEESARRHYGAENLTQLQQDWTQWRSVARDCRLDEPREDRP